MRQHLKYTFFVAWSDEDELFIGRVAEFRSLVAHGDTAELALAEIQGVVEEVLEELAESGEPVPAPRGLRTFSGRFNVRMPSELHKRLVEDAEEEGVSLNQLVVTRLAAR